MKRLIKCVSSREITGTQKNIARLYEENGIYTVEYKYTTMNKYKEIKISDYEHALLYFLKVVMFFLA